MKKKGLERYSLGLFHFNIQYAAGLPSSYFKQTTASLKPFLRFHEKFPQWKSNLEISGHHVAFLERHFPQELDRLRVLNQRGQVEIVTVHYSDQIYLAYPGRDLLESIDLADEILERNGLERSPVWFGQENFFGEGVVDVMKRRGYSIALVNGAYYTHLHPRPADAAYYTYGGVDCLLSGAQRAGDEVVQTWNFWGDGELAFARFNVYFPGYGASEKKFVERANRYFRDHEDGVKFVTVTEYIDLVKGRGYEPVPLEPLLDGSWNLYYYGGVYLWMGTYRFAFERDGEIRSLTFRSRERVLLADALEREFSERAAAKDSTIERCRALVKRAWKHQLLAEVSDSTGQTPFPIEVEYSRAEAGRAEEIAGEVVDLVVGELGLSGKWVDLATGEILDGPASKLTPVLRDIEALPRVSAREFKAEMGTGVHLRDAKGKVTIRRVDDDHYILDFHLRRDKWVPFTSRVLSLMRSSKHPGRSRVISNKINARTGFTVPLEFDEFGYSPAGLEGTLKRFKLDDFSWDEMWLPCPNGILQFGEDKYLVKHNGHGNTHLAFTIDKARGRVGILTLNPPRVEFDWRVSVFRGSEEEALALGNLLNVTPEVEL
ncbi:MAG: hypothetical protein ACTSU5_07860 [Promethearchaeota archaeon]